MANYQPLVGLSWKYLSDVNSPGKNLKIVWTVFIDLAAGEKMNFSRVSVWDTDIVLTVTPAGAEGNYFTKEWDAPFTVDYNLEDDPQGNSRETIKTQIKLNRPIEINTVVKKDGVKVGETLNQTTQNSNIQWD